MRFIDVTNLQKCYGNHVAARDVSFTLEKCEIFGIVGPNSVA